MTKSKKKKPRKQVQALLPVTVRENIDMAYADALMKDPNAVKGVVAWQVVADTEAVIGYPYWARAKQIVFIRVAKHHFPDAIRQAAAQYLDDAVAGAPGAEARFRGALPEGKGGMPTSLSQLPFAHKGLSKQQYRNGRGVIH